MQALATVAVLPLCNLCRRSFHPPGARLERNVIDAAWVLHASHPIAAYQFCSEFWQGGVRPVFSNQAALPQSRTTATLAESQFNNCLTGNFPSDKEPANTNPPIKNGGIIRDSSAADEGPVGRRSPGKKSWNDLI